MAIDSRAKRASVASLSLAFLGASVVPDGTIAQPDRQAIGNSYYGVEAGGVFVENGATSQLEVFGSTGVLTLERNLGATSQLLTFDSSGVLTLERALGATSQLNTFDSTGVLTIGAEQQGGSWLPPKKVKSKLKKKDDDILKSINELIEKLEETPEVPEALVERVEKVEVRAKKVINLDSIKEHDRQIKLVDKQIKTLEKAVNLQIKKAKQDEDDAINALLSII